MGNEMKGKELFDYRVKLFRDAIDFKKPDRTPLSGNVTHWMFHDAGYTTAYATRHYDVVEECMTRFVQKYPVDHLNIWMSGFRNFNNVTDILCEDQGDDAYSGNDENLINSIVEDMCTPDDYDAFIEDMNKANWERFLARRYKKMQHMDPNEFADSIREFCHYQEERNRIDTRMRDEFGVLVEKDTSMAWSCIENVFEGMRGVKGMSMDLRRHYDKLKEFVRVNDAHNAEWTISTLQYDGHKMSEPYDCMISILAHTVMRPSQFEDLIWPTFKPVMDYCAEHGKQIMNFIEGSWKTFGKYFNDYPKGTICMMIESDDPYETRKEFPNLALYGGLDTTVLGNGTVQQCIDMAKKAIDELGRDGGLILAPNKMVAYPDDVKAENLETVCNFVKEYK